MVVFGLIRFIPAKMDVFVRSGCNLANWLFSEKMVVFWQKSLYSGKVVVFGQKWMYLCKVVVKLLSCIREKWLYSGQNC